MEQQRLASAGGRPRSWRLEAHEGQRSETVGTGLSQREAGAALYLMMLGLDPAEAVAAASAPRAGGHEMALAA